MYARYQKGEEVNFVSNVNVDSKFCSKCWMKLWKLKIKIETALEVEKETVGRKELLQEESKTLDLLLLVLLLNYKILVCKQQENFLLTRKITKL